MPTSNCLAHGARAFASHLPTALALASTAMYPLSKELMPRSLAAITTLFVNIHLPCPVHTMSVQTTEARTSTRTRSAVMKLHVLVFYSTRQAEPKPTLVHNASKAMLS